jgi:hypothetical protein
MAMQNHRHDTLASYWDPPVLDENQAFYAMIYGLNQNNTAKHNSQGLRAFLRCRPIMQVKTTKITNTARLAQPLAHSALQNDEHHDEH